MPVCIFVWISVSTLLCYHFQSGKGFYELMLYVLLKSDSEKRLQLSQQHAIRIFHPARIVLTRSGSGTNGMCFD